MSFRFPASLMALMLLASPALAQDVETAGAVEDDPAAPPINFLVFADAYAAYLTSPVPTDPATLPFHRAYAFNNGFSLSWAGMDVSYDGENAGAVLSVRYGPSVVRFFGDQGPFGIDNVIQAYAYWKPTDNLKIDFGQFGTIYGAEVAESWRNLNYTRGALYYAMQPFWHTGVRASYAASDTVTVNAMVVNGVNSVIDGGDGAPSIGLQVAYAGPVALVLGYLGSLDPESDVFDHFVDLVATYESGAFKLVFNGDVNIDTETMTAAGDDSAMFWGLSLAAGYRLTDALGIALRGEYLVDSDNTLYQVAGAEDVNLITGTLTFDWRPTGADNLFIRWDNRFETSGEDIFLDRDNAGTDTWFQSVLGFVVTSG